MKDRGVPITQHAARQSRGQSPEGRRTARGWQVRQTPRGILAAGAAALGLTMAHLLAQTPLDEDTPWPRVRSVSNQTVTLHLPEVERWTSNSFTARAVVEVKPARAKEGVLGVVWFEAQGRVDRSNRVVTLERFELIKARFPEASDQGQQRRRHRA